MIYPREKHSFLSGEKPVMHLNFDSMADFPDLVKDYGLDKAAPGSDAFCVDTGDLYILRADTGEWEVL